MPISSSYRQKGKTEQHWNSTKSRRFSYTKKPTDNQSLEKDYISQFLVQSSAGPHLNSCTISVDNGPATGRNPLSKPYDNRKRESSQPRALSSRRPLTRRETVPEFYQVENKLNKMFKRCNSDSLIKPCDSAKRKVRRDLGNRGRIRTFPLRRYDGRHFASQNKPKKLKVDSEAKLSINNKIICFSDFHQTPQEVGQRVICIINKHLRSGITKFIGTTHFSEGVWCGIVLDEPFGKNDGSVKGVRYFTCGENYGIFVHVKKVRAVCENDLGFLPQSGADVLDGRESPDSRSIQNEDVNLKMNLNNSGIVEFKSEHEDPTCDKDCNSKITSRACNMIQRLKKSELSTNDMQTNHIYIETDMSHGNVPNIFTENDIKESEFKSGLYPTEQLSDNGSQSKHEGDTELCNGVSSVLCDESDPCCEDISRQNTSTKSGLQVWCVIEHQEKNNSSCEDILTNSTKYKGLISNQGNSAIHKRSYSSDYIIVDKNKLTKDSSCPGLHASLERNETIDPFDQGKYCSCPSLVPSQHLSNALETCIDLGRQELESPSVKSSPEEEKHLHKIHLEESLLNDRLNDDNMFKGNLHCHGRSLSLPLVLVPVQRISQTESLFWSLEKVSETLTKVERAESWPTLSTSLCNLDLRPDVNKDASFGLSVFDSDCKNNSGEGMLADDCVPKELENDDDKNLKKIMRISVVERVSAAIKTNNNCESQSGSQASVSSVGTSESQKSIQRKISASSTSSSNSQSKKKKVRPQRNSKSKPIQKLQGKTEMIGIKVNPEKKPMTLKLVKRHTLSGFEKMQPEMTSKTRPSVTKRPASTLSELTGDSSPMSSPSFAKSKLPTMRKTALPASVVKESTSEARKPQPKGLLLQQGRGIPKEKKKSTALVDKNKIATKGKVGTSELSAQKAGKNVEVIQVSRRGKPTTQSGGSGPVDKKPVTSTKTIIPSPKPSGKPLKLQAATKGSPTSKAAGTPSKHYQSRLPRKIISRDTSTDSGHSHDFECDVDTASIGTDGSDYFDGDRLVRRGSFPPDQHYDGDKSDLESSTKSWIYPSHAPDILTGTREIHTRCAEVQVQMNEDEPSREMYDKLANAEDLLVLKDKQCGDLKAVVDDSNTDILASAMLFIILCKKLQNNGRLITQLKKHLNSTESNLKQVQERLVEEEENGVKLQEELMYVRSEHTVAIQNLKADHENTLEALRYNMKKQFAEEQKKAADEHVAELLELNKVHEEKVTAVKKEHEKNKADLHEKYKDEIVELESKQSHHIDELLEEHQVEIETIKNDYEEQYGGLESKLFAVTNECTSLNAKLQQLQEETERDIELRIQDAIEKYKSLPAELESMKAVLDMRNEEIKQLRKERMESKLELDHLRKVADRAKKLQYENESLSFVVENKSKFERQLSVEREQLKNSLDRESKKLKRLSLENEELQWRLCNSSSPPDGGISPDGTSELPSSSSHRRSFRLSCSSDVDTINE